MEELGCCFMKCNVTRVGKKGKCRSQYLNTNTTNSLLGELTVRANESVPSSPGTNGFALSPLLSMPPPDSHNHGSCWCHSFCLGSGWTGKNGRWNVNFENISWALYVTKPERTVLAFLFLIELHMVPIDIIGSCVARLWENLACTLKIIIIKPPELQIPTVAFQN